MLGGTLSPFEGIGPDQLKLKSLIDRLKSGNVSEIIVATNPTAEGEATAVYVSKLIKPLGIRVTRIGVGIPVGSDLEYADEITMLKAMERRHDLFPSQFLPPENEPSKQPPVSRCRCLCPFGKPWGISIFRTPTAGFLDLLRWRMLRLFVDSGRGPVPESVPTNEPEAHKRRSTRIVQAVPLTVVGVDALGRPFQERTSTLIINCQGCRYQSKHYVLKNMWVTLEVPHPEPGRPPRTVRGRVMWIQRPRTVRELFQVGIELEVTGNFWGIAFPPADWFPVPEGLAGVPLPAPSVKSATSPAQGLLAPPLAVAGPAEDNLRTLPLPTSEQGPP